MTRELKIIRGGRVSGLQTAVLIFAIGHGATSALAQKVTATLKSEEALIPVQGVVQRIVVQRDKRIEVGQVVRKERKLLLTLPNQPPLELPRDLATMLSKDGRTILQFGDEVVKLTNPPKTDLYWLDSQGQVVGRLVDYYAGNAVVAMSDDGYTAVAGKLFGKLEEARLGLYSPKGQRIWEVPLGVDERIDQIVVTTGGQRVASLVTDAQRWLKNHRIQLREGEGEPKVVSSGLGIIQKLVLLEDGQTVFIQGYDRYGIADLGASKIVWQRPGKIRMASAYGAAISPDRKTIFVVLADVKEKPAAEYRWKLQALDVGTGEQRMLEDLPGSYASTWDRAFEQVTPTEIRILAGGKRLTYGWKTE